jgi:hypothetical protein
MSRTYRVRPSKIVGIEDCYTAYCLDEACAYIMQQIDQGNEPSFEVKYNSFTDIYKQFE